MSLRFEAEAAAEFLRAIEYYENQSAGLGAELLADVEHLAGLLESNPAMGSPGPAGTRRVLLSRFPLVAVYRLHDESVVVVALAHQRRRPGYWLGRM